MKKGLLIINLLEDSFYIVSLFMIGLIVADVLSPEKIAVFNNVLSFMCHQQSERCFFILGQPLGLCARCLGIYLGFALCSKNIGKLRRSSYLYYLSIIFIISDLIIELGLGIPLNNVSRFFFGLIFSYLAVISLNLMRNYIVHKIGRRSLQIKNAFLLKM